MFDIPQVGHLSSHIVWSTMAVDMDCGGSKVGGGEGQRWLAPFW